MSRYVVYNRNFSVKKVEVPPMAFPVGGAVVGGLAGSIVGQPIATGIDNYLNSAYRGEQGVLAHDVSAAISGALNGKEMLPYTPGVSHSIKGAVKAAVNEAKRQLTDPNANEQRRSYLGNVTDGAYLAAKTVAERTAPSLKQGWEELWNNGNLEGAMDHFKEAGNQFVHDTTYLMNDKDIQNAFYAAGQLGTDALGTGSAIIDAGVKAYGATDPFEPLVRYIPGAISGLSALAGGYAAKRVGDQLANQQASLYLNGAVPTAAMPNPRLTN